MQALSVIVFVVMGLVQMFATVAGLQDVLGISAFFAFTLAFFVTWIPVVGTILGMWGAIAAWDWPWYAAVALFMWPYLLFVPMMAGGAISDRFSGRRRQA
jgi:hypothetical protein